MQDSLVVEGGILVKFSLVPFTTFFVPLQLLLLGSLHQEEGKQPHHRDTQRSNIITYIVLPKAPDHLLLATLSCLSGHCIHFGQNFSRKSSLSRHMLVVHGASRPSKILQPDTWPSSWHTEGSVLPSAPSPLRQGSALRRT